MPSIEYDLEYLESSAELLQEFLLSKEIYWKLNLASRPGEPGFPSLTLGGILVADQRVKSQTLSSTQNSRYLSVQDRIKNVRQKWRTAWQEKAREEFRFRLDLWRNFLEEFRQDPEGNIDRYSYEVNRRVMLELLEREAADIPAVQEELLSGLDLILAGLMVPGDFIWEESLAAGFPRAEFPYLYLHLR